jgi:PAS domain S-box-containing protein
MNEIQRAQGQLVEELERLRRRVDGLRRTKHERVPSVGGLNGCDDGYRALFLNHAVGILVAEADGEGYIYANPAICRMLGYTEEQLRQNGLLHIYPKNAWQHVMSEFKAQERGEKTMAVDIPCLRRDGSTIYVDIGKSN